MADNFSANQFQGIFGEFKPVVDETVTPTANNWQGIFGLFKPVLDEAAGVVVGNVGVRHWQHERHYPRGTMSGVLRGAIR